MCKASSVLAALTLVLSVADVEAAVLKYPDYPAAIPRDYGYSVRVCQGNTKKAIPVYNRTEKSLLIGRIRGGDVNRRFCEFAFDGGEARVDIRVCEDVKCYAVFPSRLGLRHAFKNGVISVWLERPANFGIRLNDYEKTDLSVFADAPEPASEIPQKGASGVLYVDGWLDAPGRDGVLVADKNIREVYIAPGAVLNARLSVKCPNAFVHGRGMMLDPLSDIFRFDQTANTRRGFLNVDAPGVRVKDVKLVDARTFNFISWQKNVRFENVKALSAMMCSDGFTIGSRGFVCDRAWLYVGDNALVLSGCKDFVISNAVIGTSCAAIFPQGSPAGRLVDTDVFRADDGIINNSYNGVLRRKNKWNELTSAQQKKEADPQNLPHQTCDLVLERTSCVDCTYVHHLFRGCNMGNKEKKYLFNGFSAPPISSLGKALIVNHDSKRWLDTENYQMGFNGLFVGGKEQECFSAEYLVRPERMKVTFGKPFAIQGLPLDASRVEVNWTCPSKVWCGQVQVRDWRKVGRSQGEKRLPPPSEKTNLVREIWPRQSVWQRVPSWLVKLETENGTDPEKRVYKLVQCEKNAGMQAVVTEEALALGKGRYTLAFEARAELAEGDFPVELSCFVKSNDWKVERKTQVGIDWTSCSVSFDVPVDAARDDLVGVEILSRRPADTLRFRNLTFTRH